MANGGSRRLTEAWAIVIAAVFGAAATVTTAFMVQNQIQPPIVVVVSPQFVPDQVHSNPPYIIPGIDTVIPIIGSPQYVIKNASGQRCTLEILLDSVAGAEVIIEQIVIEAGGTGSFRIPYRDTESQYRLRCQENPTEGAIIVQPPERTATPTAAASATWTATATAIAATATATPTATATATETASATPTATELPTPTVQPTNTPTTDPYPRPRWTKLLDMDVDSRNDWVTAATLETGTSVRIERISGQWSLDQQEDSDDTFFLDPVGFEGMIGDDRFSNCKLDTNSDAALGALLVRTRQPDGAYDTLPSMPLHPPLEYTATQTEHLQFRINDACVMDNSGILRVTVDTLAPP